MTCAPHWSGRGRVPAARPREEDLRWARRSTICSTCSELETLEVNLFRGLSPDEDRQRVFGGQVAAQALVAAGRTVEADRPVHSLHAYFLRPGDPNIPIVFEVDRIRDGKSFTTRRVVAIQHGRAIFNLPVVVPGRRDGPDHSAPMPAVPAPGRAADVPGAHRGSEIPARARRRPSGSSANDRSNRVPSTTPTSSHRRPGRRPRTSGSAPTACSPTTR